MKRLPAIIIGLWLLTLSSANASDGDSYEQAVYNQAFDYNGFLIPAGAVCYYDSVGRLAYVDLLEDWNYAGFVFSSANDPFDLSFDGAGLTVFGRFAENVEWNGLIWKAEVDSAVNYEGQLIQGQLAESAEIYGIPFAKDNIVIYHQTGMIKRGVLSRDTVLSGVTYRAGTMIRVHTTGYVESGYLAEDAVFGDLVVNVPDGKSVFIEYYDDGVMKSFTPAVQFEWAGFTLLAGYPVEWYPSGYIKSGYINETAPRLIFFED